MQDQRKLLDNGKELGVPDGVLINGKGPYRYNSTVVPEGIKYETINVKPGEYCSMSKYHHHHHLLR